MCRSRDEPSNRPSQGSPASSKRRIPCWLPSFISRSGKFRWGARPERHSNGWQTGFDVEEVRSLAAVIEQAEKYGARVVTALQVHAKSLREKRFQRAEERAQQAAVKLLVPTVFFIFPALFVVLLGPALFDVFQLLMDIQDSVTNLPS